MNAPQSFERTHIHGKEPVRYFTPSTVGQHLGRSPSELLKAFDSGKVQSLQVGDYIYKPTASRPGPAQAMAESGLDKMEPIKEARKSAKIDLTQRERADSERALQDARNKTWAQARKDGDQAADNFEAARELNKPIKKGVFGRENEQTGESESDQGPKRPRPRLASSMKHPHDPGFWDDAMEKMLDERMKHGGEGPVKKAADSFDEEEWTGKKTTDPVAPDREKFLKTGEVSEENKKNYGGFWQSMKDRLKFSAGNKTEQELADEKSQEYLGRQMARERLPGYDEWKGRSGKPGDQPNPNDSRDPEVRRRNAAIDANIKKSADTAHGTETIPIEGAKRKLHKVGTPVKVVDNDVYEGESGRVVKVDSKADYPHQVQLKNGMKAWFHEDELKPS